MSESREIEFTPGETAEVKGIPESSAPIQPKVPESLKNPETGKDPEAFRKSFRTSGKISIKTYLDPQAENMGLEDYGMVMFPGIKHSENKDKKFMSGTYLSVYRGEERKGRISYAITMVPRNNRVVSQILM